MDQLLQDYANVFVLILQFAAQGDIDILEFIKDI